jgi:hydroxypyruvate isomerase
LGRQKKSKTSGQKRNHLDGTEMSIKQSVCISIVRPAEMSMETFLAEVAAIGYPAVEVWGIDDGFEQLCETVAGCGLKLVSFIGHEPLEDGLNNRANHDRIEVQLRASIDTAAAHDVPGLICFSGNRIDGLSSAEAIAATADGLARVAPYAEEKGVNLNLELLNSKINHVGYEGDHTAWGLEVVRRVNSPRVKLLYDIYHMQIMEGDVIRTLQEHIESIGHIHTAGVPGRHELDDRQELQYSAICAAIAATGYEGYVGHEFSPVGDVLIALRQAFAECNQ